ncbi:MAG TPA: hypothetical protein VI997_06080 [Candidatus Thermoplasmatota archaeon]|nr:hypothetical protein [Candidatus Thermoplasmatota archaeon]
MTDPIEDYLSEVGRTLRVDTERKNRILDELRAHLVEKVADERRAAPDEAPDATTRRVLADFGNPRELALAYGADGPVLKNAAGEVVLRLGQAFGRGARAVGRASIPVIKWTGIAIGCVVVLALALGVWAWYEVVPVAEDRVREWSPYPVFEHAEECASIAACSATPTTQSFYVHGDAKDVRMWVSGDHASSGTAGSVQLTVRDPGENTKYDRTFSATQGGHIRDEVVWDLREGEWTVTWKYTAFVGEFEVEIATTGLPR